jgi:hypothetical protein
MPSYRVHGITVDSFLALPGLPAPLVPPAAEPPDAAAPRIILRPGPPSLLEHLPVPEYRIEADADDRHRLLVPEGAVIEIAEGGAVQLAWTAAMPMDLLVHVVIGQVLPNALALLGRLCLHASCLQVGGGAIAVIGGQGAGKSTTAAAWLAGGGVVLADDCTVLDGPGAGEPPRWEVQPGPGRLKLWPDAIAALGLEQRARQPLHAGLEKEALVGLPIAAPAALTGIAVLASVAAASPPSARPLPAAEALPLVFANTFGHRRRSRDGRARHFQQLTRLLLSVPVSAWSVPRSLPALPAAVRLLAGGGESSG